MFKDERGIGLIFMLFVWIAAFGVMFYIIFASVGSFRRNLFVYLYPKSASNAATSKIELPSFEAENLVYISGPVQEISDKLASNGKTLIFYNQATASAQIDLKKETSTLSVRARADICNGTPFLIINIDKQDVFSIYVTKTNWTEYLTKISLKPGPHLFKLYYSNDFMTTKCDRNLWIDKVTIE